MSIKHVLGCLVAVALVATALPAEAGHRRCRTCSSGGTQGNWFHFSSGRGYYVPFATETVSAPAPYGAPMTYAGPAMPHRSYQPAPIYYGGHTIARPPCYGCVPR